MLHFFLVFLATTSPVLAKHRNHKNPGPFTPSETLYATLDWSLTLSDYDIKTLNNTLQYNMHQEIVSIGQRFRVKTANGTNVATVIQDIFTIFGPKYDVSFTDVDGSRKSATISRRYSFGFPTPYKSFNIEIDKGESFTTHGDILAWKFTIDADSDGKTVAQVDLQGQDFINLHFPGLQAYQLDTDTSRINDCFPMIMLNIVEWLVKTGASW